ncbi:MAG: TauD/TfdA family dioxygenase [Rubrivivax sp.]|nr:TauD/TfdA family dioxygenase [Rubrivivax sp.]
MTLKTTAPRAAGWTRAQIEADPGWTVRLSAAEIAGFEAGLDSARRSGRALFALSRSDFAFGAAALARLRATVAETQQGRGFQLTRGLPVERWSVDDARLLFWGVGLHLGVPRPQGKASLFMSDVRDAGGTYRSTAGRGYNTRSALDFHADGSDLVGLMCLRTARAGGESLISSSLAAHAAMQAERPDLVRELHGLFTFSRQGEQAPEEPPYYQASIFGLRDGRLACRHIRNHVRSAQLSFPEVPRLTDAQREALDYFDAVLLRPELCFRMDFEPGDMQWIDNHTVLHSRTDYEDFDEPERQRHLLRLWIASPDAPALPEAWADAYKDVSARAVRGGFRGIGISPEIEAFERRLADEHDMAFRIYADRQGVNT